MYDANLYKEIITSRYAYLFHNRLNLVIFGDQMSDNFPTVSETVYLESSL